VPWLLRHAVGWTLTALAVSLGAPFNLQSSGIDDLPMVSAIVHLQI
jgi:hypothetical protein